MQYRVFVYSSVTFTLPRSFVTCKLFKYIGFTRKETGGV